MHAKANSPSEYSVDIDLRVAKLEAVTSNLVEDPENEFESEDSFDRDTLHAFVAPRSLAIGCSPVNVKLIYFFTELDARIARVFWFFYNQYMIYKADVIISECR